MKYIKLFEDINIGFKELNFDDWSDLSIKLININKTTVHKLESYLGKYSTIDYNHNNGVYTPTSSVGEHESFFFRYYTFELIVHECNDEWYAVSLVVKDKKDKKIYKHYKCDQVYGIINLLKSLYI